MTRLLLPRVLHPLAWWAWALSLAVAAASTTNPLLLLGLVAVACCVVAARRGESTYARALRWYLLAGLAVIVIRLVFRVLLGGGSVATPGDPLLLALPAVHLPWPGAPVLLGDVTASAMLAAFTDGLRLATMLVCVGAANSLADPRRLLKSLPSALHEVGAATVVAVSILPQLAESVARVHAARRLRGRAGRDGLRAVVVPVLEDAIERSLSLAASMDARGYGRRSAVPAGSRVAASTCLFGGLMGLLVGVYCLLDTTMPRWLGVPMLVAGSAAAVLGLAAAGRRVQRSRYRPDRWLPPEIATVTAGVAVAAAFVWCGLVDPSVLAPTVAPPTWPTVTALPVVGLALALVPAVLTPPPPATRAPVDVPVRVSEPQARVRS
jgi:energy-coupling factor transport system permease protein